MAVPFLTDINLNKNQAFNLALHNATANPSTPSTGQIYYNTSSDKVLLYNGSEWVSITGDITEVTSLTTNQLTVSNGTGPVPSLSIVTGAVADGGTALATGDQIYDFVTGLGYVESVSGGTYLTNVGTATAVILDHDATSRTDTTSSDAPTYGGTFEAVTSVTTNATGHVTAIDVSTITIPSSDNTSYDLSVQAGGANDSIIRLSGSDSSSDDVVIIGDTSTIKITENTSTNTITLDLQDDVTIESQLIVGNTGASEAPIIHSKTGGTGDNILLESTNTGAGSAPDLTLYRNAGVPADSDTLGVVAFRGRNYPNNADNLYNGIYSRIIDASNQHSALTFSAYYGSNTAHVMGIHNTADSSSSGKVVINPAAFSSVPTHTLDVNGDADISSNLGVGGNLTVAGNLTVEGSTTTVESTTVTMTDNILQLNVAAAGDTQVDPTSYSGIEVVRGSNDNRQLVWNETTDKWQIETSTDTYKDIATTDQLHDAVTLAGSYDYITLAGQVLTLNQIDYTTDIANTPIIPSPANDATITVSAGSGLTGGGDFTTDQSSNETITLSHADTSSQASVNNSGRTYIQDITLDTYGHITGITSATETVTNTDTQLATREADIDVSNTTFIANKRATINHALDSENIIVQMYDKTTGAVVHADVEHTSDGSTISKNHVRIEFGVVPDNDIRVIMIDAKDAATSVAPSYS